MPAHRHEQGTCVAQNVKRRNGVSCTQSHQTYDLGHLLTVGLRVERGLGEEDGLHRDTGNGMLGAARRQPRADLRALREQREARCRRCDAKSSPYRPYSTNKAQDMRTWDTVELRLPGRKTQAWYHFSSGTAHGNDK